MKYYINNILAVRQQDRKRDTRGLESSQRNFSSFAYHFSSYYFLSIIILCLVFNFTKKCTLHSLALIMRFFFFGRICLSTSQRLPNDVFGTICRPSKDAVSTEFKNKVNILLHYIFIKHSSENPQLLPRPPTSQSRYARTFGIFPSVNNKFL